MRIRSFLALTAMVALVLTACADEERPAVDDDDGGAGGSVPLDEAAMCPSFPADPIPVPGAPHYVSEGMHLSVEFDSNPQAAYNTYDTTYDFYFGTEAPPSLIATGCTEPWFNADDPGNCTTVSAVPTLEAGQSYVWSVVSTAPGGCKSAGPLWGFTVDESSTGPGNPPCPDAPSVTDAAGITYPTVQLGDQCWMARDLNIGHAQTSIDYCTFDNECPGTARCEHGQCTGALDGSNIHKFCQDNDTSCQECAVYRWYEIMQGTTSPGTKGICPAGWRVPTVNDWQTLLAAYQLKANDLLKFFGSSGFDGRVCGYKRDSTTNWEGHGQLAMYWSSTDEFSGDAPTDKAWRFKIERDVSTPSVAAVDKNFGYYVRCIKN